MRDVYNILYDMDYCSSQTRMLPDYIILQVLQCCMYRSLTSLSAPRCVGPAKSQSIYDRKGDDSALDLILICLQTT